uniref:Secreted protein n=1 Tax=Anguilla anguilla TaxID=7936 RepID=A0A0E9WG28_ANGAN
MWSGALESSALRFLFACRVTTDLYSCVPPISLACVSRSPNWLRKPATKSDSDRSISTAVTRSTSAFWRIVLVV